MTNIQPIIEQPVTKTNLDALIHMLRQGKDDEGHKVVDKFFDLAISHVYVEMSNGKLRCYIAT